MLEKGRIMDQVWCHMSQSSDEKCKNLSVASPQMTFPVIDSPDGALMFLLFMGPESVC